MTIPQAIKQLEKIPGAHSIVITKETHYTVGGTTASYYTGYVANRGARIIVNVSITAMCPTVDALIDRIEHKLNTQGAS